MSSIPMRLHAECRRLLAGLAVALFISTGATFAPAAEAPRAAVLLRAAQPTDRGQRGLLARELARQAVLLAARESCGVATRDEVLRETARDALRQRDAAYLDARLVFEPGQPTVVVLTDRQAATAKSLAQFDRPFPGLPPPAQESLDYVALLEWCETLSREKFPAALEPLGFQPTPAVALKPKPLPPALEQRLARMAVLDQYLAVRALHEAARQQGLTDEILGGLVRGYAHLALLTEMHFDATHKVFAARSLLYAQRWFTRAPQATAARSLARWHRAYALAAAGLHQAALRDLAAAKEVDPANTAGFPAPAWGDVLDAYCRFDAARLMVADDWKPIVAKPSPLRELRIFLRMHLEEFDMLRPEDYDYPDRHVARQLVTAAHRLLPHNFRLMQEAGARGEDLDDAVVFPPEWYAELKQIPGCPPTVAELGQEHVASLTPATPRDKSVELEYKSRGQLLKLLREQSRVEHDRHEPSLGVLATLVQEESFVLAVERADEVDREIDYDDRGRGRREFRNFVLPLVADHPLRPWLERELEPSAAARESRSQDLLDAKLDRSDAHYMLYHLVWESEIGPGAPPPTESADPKKKWDAAVLAHTDDTYRDLVMALETPHLSPQPAVVARRLEQVSPHSPMAAAAMIRHDWPAAKSRAAAWETRFKQQLDVQGALARQYLAAKDVPAARRCLQQYVQLSPESWGYRALAGTYLSQGDRRRWLETLEEYLHRGDDEFHSGAVRREIAEYFLETGDDQRAIEYAKRAVEEGDSGAYLIAAQAYERLQNWLLAEHHYTQAGRDSVFSSGLEWYSFCRRTGQGDQNAARAAALESLPELKPAPPRAGRDGLPRPSMMRDWPEANMKDPDEARSAYATHANFHELDGNPRQALDHWQQAYAKKKIPWDGLRALLLAIELRDTAARDKLRKALGEAPDPPPAKKEGDQILEVLAGRMDEELADRTEQSDGRAKDIAKRLDRALASNPPARVDANALESVLGDSSSRERVFIHYLVGRFAELHGDPTTAIARYRQALAVGPRISSATLASLRLRARGYDPTTPPPKK